MTPALSAILLIVGLFLVMLIAQRLFPWIRCAICAAVSATWALLLIAYWMDAFPYPTIIAVLMGGSAVGGYYALERRTPKQLHVFRLPLLLTLFLGAFALLKLTDIGTAAVAVGVVWILIMLLTLFNNHPRIHTAVNRLIACCKNW